MEAILVPLGFFAVIVGIIWLRTRLEHSRLTKQAETMQQLLATFQSGQELADFMETDSGQQLIRQLEPRSRSLIAGSLAAGIVCVFLGLGFLGLMTRDGGFLFPGVIVLALGTGLIVAALISRRLSRNLHPDSQGPGTRTDT